MLSIYYLHGIPPLYPSLVNRYSTCVRKINTLQRLPKPACSHLLHPPLRAFRRASRGLINFIWSKRAATHTRTHIRSFCLFLSLPLFFLSFSLSLCMREVAICASILRRNKWILQSDFLNKSLTMKKTLQENFDNFKPQF